MRIFLLLSSLAWAEIADVRALGRECQQKFEAENAEWLWPRLSPPMQKVFGGSLAAMKKSLADTHQLNGAELRVVEEVQQNLPDGYVYARRMVFEKSYVQFIWSFDRNGQIIGLLRKGLAPDPLYGEAPTKFGDYHTKTRLKLPFRGEWKVFWGGRTVKENYHASTVDQRFAYDFTRGHTGDGSKNEQYGCFGQPVLAPGAGQVVAAEDGVADNRPGDMPTDHPCGNQVVIDHGNGELSRLCHLQKGSVSVKAGAKVSLGDAVGKCGNSGHSSEPHLHYSLENNAKNYAGEGLPAQFLDYLADGKKITLGEPTRGQTIMSAER